MVNSTLILQVQNSCKFYSQKESIMPLANVKQAAKPELIGKVHQSDLSQKADKTSQSNVVDLQKQPSCSRMFEAFNDCV